MMYDVHSMNLYIFVCILFFLLLDNIGVMVIVWRLRENLIRTPLCWLCDTMFTVSNTLIWAVVI